MTELVLINETYKVYIMILQLQNINNHLAFMDISSQQNIINLQSVKRPVATISYGDCEQVTCAIS